MPVTEVQLDWVEEQNEKLKNESQVLVDRGVLDQDDVPKFILCDESNKWLAGEVTRNA